MIKFSQMVRVSVVSLAICGATLAAGPALAFTHTYGELAAAENEVAFRFGQWETSKEAFNGAEARLNNLWWEYDQWASNCWRNGGVGSNAGVYCLAEADQWYQDETFIRSADVESERTNVTLAYESYIEAVSYRDTIASDCCVP